MNTREVEERILGGTTARRGDVVITRGEGCWLFDESGNKYLDLGRRRVWRCSVIAIRA